MMNELCVMDRTGDTKTIWDPDNKDQVEVAKTTFNTLKAKGYLAYTVEEGGKRGTMITSFDPRAGKIIMSPPMAGG